MCPKSRTGPGIAALALAWVGLALAAMLWLATGVTAARANGGATEVFRSKQGPYEIAVGIIPPTPQVGILHFTVTVMEMITVVGMSTQRPVTSATVTIEAQGPQGSTGSKVAAVNTYGAPNYYDANISLDTPGEWQFQVAVDSPLGKERVTFPLRVQQITVNWGAIASILAAIVLVLPLVVVGYQSLRRRGQSRPKRNKPQPRSLQNMPRAGAIQKEKTKCRRFSTIVDSCCW